MIGHTVASLSRGPRKNDTYESILVSSAESCMTSSFNLYRYLDGR